MTDMTGMEIMETIVSLLQAQMLPAARDLARKAHRERPADMRLKLIHAFCTIPFDAEEAEGLLNGLAGDLEHSPAATLDRAAVALMHGRAADAVAIAATVDASEQSSCAWLWDPVSLPGSPRIMYGSAREWSERLKGTASALPSSARQGAIG